MGRITALSKPDGGVRGIVVVDIVRRLVARTMSKQITKEAVVATPPVRTRHQSSTDEDEHATIVSVDGIDAYDTISRRAMLQGVMLVLGGDRDLPFLKQFYSSPSIYVWEDDMGINLK